MDINTCPFCGSESKLIEDTVCWGHGDYHKSAHIQCRGCLAKGPTIYDTEFPNADDRKAEAVRVWNRRYKEKAE